MRASAILLLFAAFASPLAARAQVVVAGPNGAVGTSLNVATLSTGNVLSVTPAVSGDRRYVGMAIDTQFSSLNGIDTFVLNNPLGLGGVGPIGRGPATAIGGLGVTPAFTGRDPFRPAQVGHVVMIDHDKPLLATQVPALNLKALSFKDSIRRLADASKLNLVLNPRAFQQAGIDITAPHDLSLSAGTVKSALLAITQAAAPDTDLVITAEDKVIQISTQAQDDKRLISKTYYLQDLLANMGRYVPGGTDLSTIGNHLPKTAHDQAASPFEEIGDMTRALDTSKSLDPYYSEVKARAASHTHPPAPAAKKPVARAPRTSTNILEIISSTVRPEIWKNHGGKADISQAGDRVTIIAPSAVHALLEGPSTYNPNQAPTYIMYQR